MRPALLTITTVLLGGVLAYFSEDFSKFLERKYGEEPVVFVHGVATTANVFVKHREYFIQHGYSPAELYATTYGDGGLTEAFDVPILCKYIQQIRQLIIAVREYTGSKNVDVIAWSMGCAITRKAVLGGQCHDTDEELGNPITEYVNAFVAVGGVTYGIQGCPKNRTGCNAISSMHCDSQLVLELNNASYRYEGTYSYAIFSCNDLVLGRDCCGSTCGDLNNANARFVRNKSGHIGIIISTLPLQYNILSKHTGQQNSSDYYAEGSAAPPYCPST
ncbi:Lipase EstA [Toxocara canis]|uniref:Lipase EstA n=1 Tax=Toxocara canis TaxID=6265 RepID=A0A0B2VQW4_TOXCA|nr:Lipase EstA [Toxocara canis]